MTERKWMYVPRGEGESHEDWATRIRGDVSQRLLDLRPSRLELTLTEAPPPKPVLFPFKSKLIAIFNVYDDSDDPSRFTEALQGAANSVDAYEVEEAYPVAYERDWSIGAPTPSPILLTMLRKKRGITEDDYIRRWHDGHTPLSLKIHPLWYYQRNVVRKHLTEGGEPWDGIVLEACRTRGDLLNPLRFFGGALKMLPNMIRVGVDISGFLDPKGTETYYATEYHLRG
jgi:hypothetical protein